MKIKVVILSLALSACAGSEKSGSNSEPDMIEMKDLSVIKLGDFKDDIFYNVPVKSSDSVFTDANGRKYVSYHYFCKIGIESQYNNGSLSYTKTPIIDYWMSFVDDKLVFKGPNKKYDESENEDIRKVGSDLRSHRLNAQRLKIRLL